MGPVRNDVGRSAKPLILWRDVRIFATRTPQPACEVVGIVPPLDREEVWEIRRQAYIYQQEQDRRQAGEPALRGNLHKELRK